MKINFFKNDGKQLFDSLLPCNDIIQQVYNKHELIGEKRSEWWFNPVKYQDMEMPPCNTGIHTKNKLLKLKNLKDARLFQLYLYFPNYITILLLNTLFQNRKDILIEDLCGGDGRLFLFLSKLGYNNFSLIDNFSQLNEQLFYGMMKTNNLRYILNDNNTRPIVISHMGYPLYPKNNLPDSVELICQYGNTRAKEMLFELIKNDEYIELCRDCNEISVAYCRKDKYDEFLTLIKPYEDIE